MQTYYCMLATYRTVSRTSLHQLSRRNISFFRTNMFRYRKLEYLSCTDVQQAWGISKSQKSNTWGAKRVVELCCVRKPKEVLAESGNTDEILSDSFKRILSGKLSFD